VCDGLCALHLSEKKTDRKKEEKRKKERKEQSERDKERFLFSLRRRKTGTEG
jgi:hypothetical protein